MKLKFETNIGDYEELVLGGLNYIFVYMFIHVLHDAFGWIELYFESLFIFY